MSSNPLMDAHDRRERRRSLLIRTAEIVIITLWLFVIAIVWDAGT